MRDLLTESKERLLREYFPNLPSTLLIYFQGFKLSDIRAALIKYSFSDVWELLDYLKGKEMKEVEERLTIPKAKEVLLFDADKFIDPVKVKFPLPYLYRFKGTRKCVFCGKPAISNLDICLEHWPKFEADEALFWAKQKNWETILAGLKTNIPRPTKIWLSNLAVEYLPYIIASIQETRVWLVGQSSWELIWAVKLLLDHGLIYTPIIKVKDMKYFDYLPSPFILLGKYDLPNPGMIVIPKLERHLEGVVIIYK